MPKIAIIFYMLFSERSIDLKDIVLFGAGGSGREIAFLIERINRTEKKYNLLGFVDDNEKMWGQVLNGVPVLGGTEWLIEHKDSVYCNVTIGLMGPRVAVCDKLEAAGIMFETLIDPTASIGPDVIIGRGCIVNEHCELPVNIRVGDYVFLNSDTCLGHDDIIGNYTICNPHVVISGACEIGEKVIIGGMSFLVQMAKVGAGAVIAPGSVVYGRVKAGNHVMGNPARKVNL